MNENEKDLWKAASAGLRTEQRSRLDPPTSDELRAFYRDEMTESEKERMREVLIAYPEYVPKEKLQGQRPILSVMVVVLTSLLAVTMYAAIARRRANQPSTRIDLYTFESGVYRGAPGDSLKLCTPFGADHLLFVIPLYGEPPLARYGIALEREDVPRKLWEAPNVRASLDLHAYGALAVHVPASYLEDGRYTFVVGRYDAAGGRTEIARHKLTVVKAEDEDR